MEYSLGFRPQARKDLRKLSPEVAERVLRRIAQLRVDLRGDVKRLVDFVPAYRLRVGDYRVLFAVEGDEILVYRVLHRREAYDR